MELVKWEKERRVLRHGRKRESRSYMQSPSVEIKGDKELMCSRLGDWEHWRQEVSEYQSSLGRPVILVLSLG